MVSVLDNLFLWMQNIHMDNLLYENYCVRITEQSLERLTVLKLHQFHKTFLLFTNRHDQCTWKTLVYNIIISPQFRKKCCFQSHKRDYRTSGKSSVDKYMRTIFYTFCSMLCCHMANSKAQIKM